MNYLDYLDGTRSAEVRLGGRTVRATRAGLGLHFRLTALAQSQDGDRMLRYVALASGIAIEVVGTATFDEVMKAYLVLLKLNQLDGVFPFMGRRQDHEEDPLDYPGRALARIVHVLAAAYHWSEEAILAMAPERALFYVLEVLADDHQERHWQWTLSSVGFDKNGRKQPFSPMPWRWGGPLVGETKVIKISRERALRAGMIPFGEFVDLEKVHGSLN